MVKLFKVEKGKGKSKVTHFIKLSDSQEDVEKIATFVWLGWKIMEVKE